MVRDDPFRLRDRDRMKGAVRGHDRLGPRDNDLIINRPRSTFDIHP